ncbi:helix-turn-helix transcriptional regulator [Cytobacillus sp. Hm23]
MERNLIIEHKNGLLLNRTTKLGERSWRNDPVYKFIFSINGESHYQMKQTDVKLHENSFLLINPMEDHKQLSIEKEKLLIELDVKELQAASESILQYGGNDIYFAQMPHYNPQLTKWVQFVKDFVSLENDSLDSLQSFIDHSTSQLAIMLMKYSINSHSPNWPSQLFESPNEQIQKTIKAMKESYNHKWTLDDMASIAHLSKYQLSHIFKEKIGISPYSWLQLYRLYKSQHLLVYSKKTIIEIALACGFSSTHTYNQLFKKVYNITPTMFRKKYAR